MSVNEGIVPPLDKEHSWRRRFGNPKLASVCPIDFLRQLRLHEFTVWGCGMAVGVKAKGKSWENFKEILLGKRDELIQQLTRRRSQVAIENDVDDEGAVALRNVSRDLTMANMEREVRTLAEVELSLRLLESGQYGLCGSCGDEIPAARLKALPWTRICITCAGGGVKQLSEVA